MPFNLNFKDYTKITKPTEAEVSKFKDNLGSSGNSIWVMMDATHSAVLNRNKRFYIPALMRDGTSTFKVGNKPTKILKHHDASSDPIGVVRQAQFVTTVPNDLVNDINISTLLSSTASPKEQLASMRKLMKDGILDREDWRGLGYIQLAAEIMDSDAIKKIQDGRLDAVSTSFNSPGAAYCSICAQNIAKDGWCDHDEGQLYEDDCDDGNKFPAMIIPGVHNYDECSFVVIDADPLTTVEIIDPLNNQNNKTFFLPYNEDVFVGKTTFEFKDSVTNKEEKIMFNIESLSAAERKIFDMIKTLRPKCEDENLAEYAKSINSQMNDDGVLPNQIEAELNADKAVEYSLEDLESKDQKINGDETCDEMQKELALMKDESLLTEEEFTAADAKLSTEARKKLGKSTFCGPDRSFPVPDCAHVTAARRLIGRYKGPGNKASILACVSKKAKALGCKPSKDSVKPNSEDTKPAKCQSDLLKDMKDDELRNHFHSVELELINRKLTIKRECSDCATHIEEAKTVKETVITLEAKVADFENTFAVLRDELKRSYGDYAEQVDECVKLGVELNISKAEKLAMIGVLTQKYPNVEDAMTELKGIKDFKSVETTIMDSFDLKASTEKLNDGMSREPSGKIENPDQSIIDNKNNLKLTKPQIAAIDNIKDYLKDGQTRAAKRLYDTMVSMSVFDEKITYENISAEIDNADK